MAGGRSPRGTNQGDPGFEWAAGRTGADFGCDPPTDGPLVFGPPFAFGVGGCAVTRGAEGVPAVPADGAGALTEAAGASSGGAAGAMGATTA
jgi:hypothetical protein